MSSSTAAPHAAPARPLHREIRRRTWTWLQSTSGRATLALRGVPAAAAQRGFAILRKLAARDPARALDLVRRARRVSPGSAFLAQAAAILTARARGWAAAGPLFLGPAVRRAPGAGARLLRRRPPPALALALPAPSRPDALPAETLARIVVYATAFGAERPPQPIHDAIAGPRFLLLTDRAARRVPGWETVVTAPEVADPALAGAWCRILAHRVLAAVAPEAEASLCLAPDRRLVGNLDTLFARWLWPQDLALWRHDAGIDWWDLAEAALIAAPAPAGPAPATLLAQARSCEAQRLPRDAGACDTGMIWRRHRAEAVVRLMEAWWAELQAAPGLEATALYAALENPASRAGAAPALRPRILPAALGAAGDNAFVAIRPAPPRLAPRRVGGPLPVAFVYAEKYAASASTFIRGRQLSEMVAAGDPGRYDMGYTADLASLRDRVVVMTKGALEVHPAEAIAALAARNIAVIGSWDDMLPEAEKVAATTASMTVSHRQTTDFARLFPEIPAFHVTHHVNTQIRTSTPPTDRLRVGYFGLLRNTWRPESLGGFVDLVGMDTATVEMDWLDLLPRYNCHWIVRRRARAHDGWKPFLKGFVAARCNAVVVAMREDDDALQYLGDDYPLYVRGPDPAQLESGMAEIAAGFGGPEWRRARAIMAQVAARSTDAVVRADFAAMIAALVC